MLTNTYIDAADNTTFHADCEGAFYSVLFCESGVLANVSEAPNTEIQRTDYWWMTPELVRRSGTIQH